MIRTRTLLAAAGAVFCLVPALLAETAQVERAGIVRQSPTGTTYSVEVPVLARVQGTAFFRTSIDINNNTSKNGVTAQFQFSYTCVAASCSPVGGFYRTSLQTVTLQGLGNFHQDDFIQYLDAQGLLVPGAVQGTIGTLLVTFANLNTSNGWEGTVVARTYNRLNEADAASGTVGFAYNASLFFESADTTLVSYGRDTKSNPTIAGKLRTNLGVRNTDINATNQNVTVVVTCYDTVSGSRVGNAVTLTGIQPGEVRQISDLWATAGIPSTVNSVIIFVDNPSPTATSPTFEGYATIVEGQTTQDAAFFEARCADSNGCGN
jgi:hypothetical protein